MENDAGHRATVDLRLVVDVWQYGNVCNAVRVTEQSDALCFGFFVLVVSGSPAVGVGASIFCEGLGDSCLAKIYRRFGCRGRFATDFLSLAGSIHDDRDDAKREKSAGLRCERRAHKKTVPPNVDTTGDTGVRWSIWVADCCQRATF